ncbi:MAG TPA: flippase [Armatimonadota bacterium]
MTRDKSFGKNILYSGGSAVSNVFLIVIGIMAARILGDRSFGYFSFALALASIFETGIDLGMNTLVVRSIARKRDLAGTYLATILAWKLVLSIVSMTLMVLTVNILHPTAEARTATYIIGAAIVLRSYKATTHSFFQAYERFDLIMLTTFVERIGIMVFTVAALLWTRRLIPFAAAYALVRIPDLFYAMWLVHRHIAPIRLLIPKRQTVKEIQLGALPFGASGVIATLYASIGTVILSSMSSMENVGLYSASYKIYEGLTMFPYIICAVLLPRISSLYGSNREKHHHLSLQVIRYLILSSIPVMYVTGLFSTQIIFLFYGREYLPAVVLLRILLGAAALMFVNWTLTTVLNSADKEKVVLRITSYGLLVMTAATLLLVKFFGNSGAAYAVVVSEAFVFVMYVRTVSKSLFRVPIGRLIWRPAVATAAALLLTIPASAAGNLAAALAFVLAYTLALYVLRVFDAEDIETLKSLIPTRSAKATASGKP